MTSRKISSDVSTKIAAGLLIGGKGITAGLLIGGSIEFLYEKPNYLANGALCGAAAGLIYAGVNCYKNRKNNSIEERLVWPIPRTKQEWDDEK